MSIIIDSDKNLSFETNSFFRVFLNYFFVPIINILPSNSINIIKKSHKSVNEIVNNVTNHVALEVLYKNGHKHHTNSIIKKIFHKVWFNTSNSKGVRNRLKLVKRELTNKLLSLKKDKKNISIVSIASGSARAVIESIQDSNISRDINLSTIFLDKNPNALRYSENLLKFYELDHLENHKYQWVCGTAGTYIKSVIENSCDIIEMVGLLDYFDDKKALDLFKDINLALNNDGMFITANICPNNEQKFLTNVVGWDMVYRSAEELKKLLIDSGFSSDNIKIYYEPLKIHCVAVAIKK